MLTASILVATAFVAGVTGAWSPCGFSMVETLGSAAPRVGARAVRLSSATFALGALVGGAFTFTLLGALGQLLQASGEGLALGAAVAIALLAALGEALGVRIVPQIRRQVPESWRRTMSLPLAAGLYGVLLGLGFTTFVLTLAVWALAGISVAIGSPLAGLLIGLGFGAGRALPVVAMAPRYATVGERLEARMAEEPALLRRLRLADAALLTVLAVVLLSTGSALAAAPTTIALDATDPSVAGDQLAWLEGGARGVIVQGDARAQADAQNVAIGGPYMAVRTGDRITVTDRTTGAVVASRDVQRTTQLAVSRGWLVWRTSQPGGGDALHAATLPTLQDEKVVAALGARGQIGRPSLAGDRLAYAVTTEKRSRIVVLDLARSTARTVVHSLLTQLSQPALRHHRLLYVEANYCSQRLRLGHLGRLARGSRTLLQIGSNAHRDAGHDHGNTTQGREPSLCPRGTPGHTETMLWTTALDMHAAYVTLLRPSAQGRPGTELVRVGF